ncbi:hypothetical protein LHJ74_30800 [Streptomyces sp. N2-109]|uniref:Uncharacterized protein n=1 Tax=Streptomyces gossypii TaxID=2883101 RepID=A0ABT2K241_9ACTN|nr:hypothetical protein [Streptomyces gossypii]MCT2594246.1 hypothetical protein [Streptomyces gossypii]
MLDSIFEAEEAENASKYEPHRFTLNPGMLTIGEDKNGKPIDKPTSLPTWRFVSEDRDTLSALAELYGGTPEEFTTTKKTGLHLISEAPTIEAVVHSPSDIDSNLILWGPHGPAHKCDGRVYTSRDEDEGQPCGCERFTPEELRARASSGKGGAPFTEYEFTLAGKGDDLGKGKFINGGKEPSNWKASATATKIRNAAKRAGEPILVEFLKEFYSFTTDTGQLREGYRAVLSAKGTYSSAVAENR